MAELIDICGPDGIRNFFVRAQHNLGDRFTHLDPIMGIWDGKIKNLGPFPTGSGWAARTTTLGFKRLRFTDIQFNPKVGLQDDCATSCDTPAEVVDLGSANNDWYRMTSLARNTEVFCLESMWGDALNLREQLENHIRTLRGITEQVMDEFKRRNYVAIAAHKWLGVDGAFAPEEALWRFATDANGTVNVDYIILDPGVDPATIALPSIPMLNSIVATGVYNGGFPRGGGGLLITDWETMQELPKYDTNVRADNRYRQPGVLNPAYMSVQSYANFDFLLDPFSLRYYYTEDDPAYPNGVLKRIEVWTDEAVTNGCWDKINPDYLRADFIVHPFYNDNVVGLQSLSLPTNLPGGTYDQKQAPYDGMWKFYNEINEITPCNVDRNKAFWRMLFDMAAKPMNSGQYGHVVLTRRFGGAGLVKSCRTLQTLTGGTVDCTDTCPPLDWSPPALVTRTVCGSWSEAAATGCVTP